MFDLRPVGYVIGWLLAALGATMLLPLGLDLLDGHPDAPVFAEAALITTLGGALVVLACANARSDRLSVQQTFILTTGVWAVLPMFAALPFLLGGAAEDYTDALFEAMSGMTTTGSTVIGELETRSRGLLLWRALLQWYGGIGIVVFAMIFLPQLRVGGMQIFRTEAFDTMGKILPRATGIALGLAQIYVALTLACAAAYGALGMGAFDAVTHAMTTVATGGFANYDDSFAVFGAGIQWTAIVFMVLAALPFVRFVQLAGGSLGPLWRDSQVRAFLGIVAAVSLGLAFYLAVTGVLSGGEALRQAAFNSISIVTGTGYASTDYMLWGPFAAVVLFFAGLIGGCAGSTSCSIKVFRYQLLVASISAQVRRLYAPSGLFEPRYQGRPIADDVINSVMAFFMLFFVTLGVTAVALSLAGLDFVTAISGAATALGNVGPGLGPEIGPAGNFADLNDAAKTILTLAMLIGRLELMAVLVIFTARFWQA